MKNASTSTILATAPAVAATMALWGTAEARVFGLVALPTAIVAALLVVYFDWREQLSRRMLADPSDHRTVARLARSRLAMVCDSRRGHWLGACHSVRG